MESQIPTPRGRHRRRFARRLKIHGESDSDPAWASPSTSSASLQFTVLPHQTDGTAERLETEPEHFTVSPQQDGVYIFLVSRSPSHRYTVSCSGAIRMATARCFTELSPAIVLLQTYVLVGPHHPRQIDQTIPIRPSVSPNTAVQAQIIGPRPDTMIDLNRAGQRRSTTKGGTEEGVKRENNWDKSSSSLHRKTSLKPSLRWGGRRPLENRGTTPAEAGPGSREGWPTLL